MFRVNYLGYDLELGKEVMVEEEEGVMVEE